MGGMPYTPPLACIDPQTMLWLGIILGAAGMAVLVLAVAYGLRRNQ